MPFMSLPVNEFKIFLMPPQFPSKALQVPSKTIDGIITVRERSNCGDAERDKRNFKGYNRSNWKRDCVCSFFWENEFQCDKADGSYSKKG